MKINHIEIQNFRGFEQFGCELSDRPLIVGQNGSGKTSLMAALAIGAGSLFLGFSDIPSRGIQKEDVRRVWDEKEQVFKPQYPVVISCRGIVNGHEISWTRTLETEQGRTTEKHAKDIKKTARELQTKVRSGQDVLLPIVAYYGSDRFWDGKLLKSVKPNKPKSIILGNLNWFYPTKHQQQLWEWFAIMELIARQEGTPWRIFLAVKKAMIDSLDNVRDVTYDFRENQLLFKTVNRGMQAFWMLSDGDRNFLGMVTDIAYRCVNLNPRLLQDATRQTPGIVLIDELDLYLDSKSKKNIIKRLREIFPMIQFIVTTHSSTVAEEMEVEARVELPFQERFYVSR